MKKVLFLVVALSLICLSQANADYSFSYVSNDASVNISGMLLTPSNGAGPLTVTGGYFGAATLIAGSGLSPLGAFVYDNQLSPGSLQKLTSNGLLFAVTGKEINIYGNSAAANDYTYMEWSGSAYPSGAFTPDLRGTFTVNAVPIPAAIWLFGAGLVGLVGVRRRFKA